MQRNPHKDIDARNVGKGMLSQGNVSKQLAITIHIGTPWGPWQTTCLHSPGSKVSGASEKSAPQTCA